MIQILNKAFFKIVSSKWRANGKCQTWKTRPNEFKLPIKHGLHEYGYITHENAHLFKVEG